MQYMWTDPFLCFLCISYKSLKINFHLNFMHGKNFVKVSPKGLFLAKDIK